MRLTEAAAARLEALGHERVAVDAAPFVEAAALLYGGPWVAERYAAVGAFLEAAPPDADPTVRGIVLAAKERRAFEQHLASYRLAELRRDAEAMFAQVDVLLLPTTPTIPTLADVAARSRSARTRRSGARTTSRTSSTSPPSPCRPGSARTACRPASRSSDPAFSEAWLLPLAGALHRAAGVPWGATGVAFPAGRRPASGPPGPASGRIPLAVVGAHLRGQPLHGAARRARRALRVGGPHGARLSPLRARGHVPPKPGCVRDDHDGGAAIQVEVWSLSPEGFGRFVAGVPSPLCIGTVQLADGRSVHGFLCEPAALRRRARDHVFGGWLAYRQALESGDGV